jgi:hypothetical protein
MMAAGFFADFCRYGSYGGLIQRLQLSSAHRGHPNPLCCSAGSYQLEYGTKPELLLFWIANRDFGF